MKKLLFILIISFSYTGTLWIDGGIQSGGELDVTASSDGISASESASSNFNDAGISIGYDHMFGQNGKIIWGSGASIYIVPISDIDIDIGFTSLYGIGSYAIDDKLSMWLKLGYAISSIKGLENVLGSEGIDGFDDDNWEGGLTYGFGFQYKATNTIGLGLGHTINYASYIGDVLYQGLTIHYDIDLTVDRTYLFCTYTF